jgi:hypothetical protein
MVTQTRIAAYFETAATGVDIQVCLIDEDYTLVPHSIWLWDGTAGEHRPTTDEDLALMMPDDTARSAWVGRPVKVVLDYEVIAEFCASLLEDQAVEFRKAA